jgi:hypothetical protein
MESLKKDVSLLGWCIGTPFSRAIRRAAETLAYPDASESMQRANVDRLWHELNALPPPWTVESRDETAVSRADLNAAVVRVSGALVRARA